MTQLESPNILFTLVAFLLALGPLVFVHELGHYLAGRWFGVKAETFSIGFGRTLASWTDRRGTVWKLGLLPLGGYVQFAGDRDAASRPDAEWQSLPAAERSQAFPAKPLWQRAIIVAAGPFTNFLFAILVLGGFALVMGQVTTPPVAGRVMAGSAAERAGILPGDRFVAVDGEKVAHFGDIPMRVIHRAGEPIRFTVERSGASREVVITPALSKEKDGFGNVIERGLIGIGPPPAEFRAVPVWEAPLIGAQMTWAITRQIAEVLWQLVSGQRSVEDMGGPLMIAKASGEQASLGAVNFIGFVALISINLGFINLLPLPMLDGGHLLFYAIEAVRRRPTSAWVQEWAFRVGFAMIVTLMLVVTFNDLTKVGVWQGIARLIG